MANSEPAPYLASPPDRSRAPLTHGDGFDGATVAEQLEDVKLYASQQGDKFHPFSDTLLAIFGQSEQEAQEQRRGELVEALIAYEGAPASPYHSYHTDRIRSMLKLTEEDAG